MSQQQKQAQAEIHEEECVGMEDTDVDGCYDLPDFYPKKKGERGSHNNESAGKKV
jgi:hypothetical protein